MEVAEVFDDLIGQKTAKKWLTATLGSGDLPQALIFAGPKGTGRKTAARMLARYLHNQGRDILDSSTSLRMTGEKMDSRLRGNDGGIHPDTFWYSQILEEVSRGETREWIDAMRELIRKLTMSPMASKYKVAIIDDGEKLNEFAQNAILKTFEEPRGDTVIIFIVPNEEVLLPTIVSRAQVVRFGPLSAEEIKQIVPEASNEQIVASGGSAGQVKDWVEMPIWWVDHKAMIAFWQKVQTADIETKFTWAGKFKERDEAVEFIRTGMLVWRAMLPDAKAAKGLERMGLAVEQIRDNVNLRGAIDTLLLAL